MQCRATGAAMILLCARAATAQRLARPVIDTVDHHIVRVTNNGPSAWADTNGWKLVYERTVQPADGSAGELGDPDAAVLLGDGRLIESETKNPTIRLFDATGHLVRIIGRVGEGPGEYRNPNPMVAHDTLFVHDPALHRGTVYALDGTVVRSFATVCCSFGAPYWIDDHGTMTAQGMGRKGAGEWVRIDATGDHRDTLPLPLAGPRHLWEVLNANGQPSATVTIPLTGQTGRLVLHDGRILFGATDGYQLIFSTNTRDTTRIFMRTDARPAPVTNAVRDSMLHQFVKALPALAPIAHARDIPATYPLWSSVTEDGLGNLWVERNHGSGAPRTFDVFSRDGVLLGAVPIPFRTGRVASWNRSELAVIDVDENDLPRIRIYRVDRHRN